MILRQVREHGGGEPRARHAAEREGVRGDLHRAGPVAAVGHRPQVGLEVDRLGGGALHLTLAAGDDRLDGAEQPGLGPARFQQAAHQIGRRRLAVGPRHADQFELARRMLVEAVGNDPHRVSHRRDDELRGVEFELALDDERRRAGRERVSGEAGTIDVEAADAEEQRARLDTSTVIRQRRDLGIGRHPAGGLGCELAQPHRFPSVGCIAAESSFRSCQTS